MIQADYDRELGKVRAAEGGTDGLNAAVRRMIGAGQTSFDQPEVQAAACGDDGALQLDGASAKQLTAWAVAAAGGGYDDLLRKLLEAGVDPLTVVAGGLTPLTAAAQSGMAEAVRMCLAAAPGGAAAAAKRQFGPRARTLRNREAAATGGHAEAMRVLLDAGADANQADEDGERPRCTRAADDLYLEAMRLLLEKGAAVDAKTKKGATPLMLACQNGHVEAARLLLEKGAAVDAKDKTGADGAHARLPEGARGGGAAAAREGRGGGREERGGRDGAHARLPEGGTWRRGCCSRRARRWTRRTKWHDGAHPRLHADDDGGRGRGREGGRGGARGGEDGAEDGRGEDGDRETAHESPARSADGRGAAAAREGRGGGRAAEDGATALMLLPGRARGGGAAAAREESAAVDAKKTKSSSCRSVSVYWLEAARLCSRRARRWTAKHVVRRDGPCRPRTGTWQLSRRRCRRERRGGGRRKTSDGTATLGLPGRAASARRVCCSRRATAVAAKDEEGASPSSPSGSCRSRALIGGGVVGAVLRDADAA